MMIRRIRKLPPSAPRKTGFSRLLKEVQVDESSPPPDGAFVGVGSTPIKDVVESVIKHLEAPPPHSEAVTEKKIGSQAEQSRPV